MRLAVLLLAVSAFGQDLNSISRTASGNITGANSSCLGYNCVWIVPPPNANAVTVQITGTFSGTVVFEATTTGVSYSSVAATNGDTSATATGTWNFPLYGYRAFRVRGSAYVSGPVVVSIGAASAATAGTGGWTDDGSTITAAAGRDVSISGDATIGTTVLEFAPVGTDSTAALQAALDAYNHVKLRCGTFIVTRIQPPSNRTLQGSGPCSIIKAKDAASVDTIYAAYNASVENVILSDFAIDGNKANTTGDISGISMDGRKITVRNVHVSNTRGRCIQLSGYRSGSNDGDALVIDHNVCTDPSVSGGFSPGIAIMAGSGSITNNTVTSASPYYMTAGIDIEPNAGWVVGKVVVSGNEITNGSIAASTAAGGGAAINSLSITGNVVNGENVGGNGNAINIDTVTGDLLIGQNLIYANTSAGVNILGTSYAKVIGNKISQRVVNLGTYPSALGIILNNSSYAQVADNFLYSLLGTTSGGGINEIGTSNNNTLSWNKFFQIGTPHTVLGANTRYVWDSGTLSGFSFTGDVYGGFRTPLDTGADMGNNGFRLGSGSMLKGSSTTNFYGTPDVGFRREGAGRWELNQGTAGRYGDIVLRHIISAAVATYAPAPTIASGFGTTPSIAGTDTAGRVTVGTGGDTTGAITFGTTWGTAPVCTCNNETTTQACRTTATTSALTLTGTFAASDKVTFMCVGY